MEQGPPRSFAPNAVHMIRTVQMIHVQLSAMADQKASILMGASFVIFTITINQAHGTLPPVPLLVLGGFAFLSAICAVMAIVPKTKVPEGAPVDLLFFGSFVRMPVEDYVTQVVDVMADEETMLRAIAADVYGNGQVLYAKKYRYLELSYRLFLVGLIAAAAAFVAQYAL
jgi:Family of unknown function (DUF5706)